MVLNELGYNISGNVFHAVPRDLAIILITQNEFGTVTVDKLGSSFCSFEDPALAPGLKKKPNSGVLISFENLSDRC